MAYHGIFRTLIKTHVSATTKSPLKIVEIGVDAGMTFVPLAAHLARTHNEFELYGVDIDIKEHVKIIMKGLTLSEGQKTNLVQQNSLEFLPVMLERGEKFDVILLDGDHNYSTVSRELNMIYSLIDWSCGYLVIDDYVGKYATTDMWYGTPPDLSRQLPGQSKQGVATAVNEWLKAHNELRVMHIWGEPIVVASDPVMKQLFDLIPQSVKDQQKSKEEVAALNISLAA